MGERSDKSTPEYVPANSKRLAELLYSSSVIVKGIIMLDDGTMIVTHAPRSEYLRPCRYSSVLYAAITTATARKRLLKAMKLVGDRLVYIGNLQFLSHL